MNTTRTIVVCVIVAVVFAALGVAFARYSVKRHWEIERDAQKAESQRLAAESERLKDVVRKIRTTGREQRAKANPPPPRPKPKAEFPPGVLRSPTASRPLSPPVPPLRWPDEK